MAQATAVPLTEYLDAALAGDRERARAIAEGALASGLPIRRLYLEVFQAAQREVGERWARGTIGVGDEHRATAVTQYVIAALYDHIVASAGHGCPVVLGVVGPERHEVGPRMVADFAEMAGYDVSYTGVLASSTALVEVVRRQTPKAVGLSITLPNHLPVLGAYIRDLRAALGSDSPTIIVGGRALAADPEAWRKLGADCHAEDADGAVACLDERCRA